MKVFYHLNFINRRSVATSKIRHSTFVRLIFYLIKIELSDSLIHYSFGIQHSSFHRFPAFFAPAIRTDDADAIAVIAELTAAPVIRLSFLPGWIIGSGLSRGIYFLSFAGPIGWGFFSGNDGLRQGTFILLAALLTVPVRTDHTDAVAVFAQYSVTPIRVRKRGFWFLDFQNSIQ